MTTQLTDRKNLFCLVSTLDHGKMERESILRCLGISASTFYKHLNLIKRTGFKVKREKDVYELVSYKNIFNFAKYEISVFVYLLLIVYVMLPVQKIKHFANAVDKMLSMSRKEDALAVEEKYETHRIATISEYYSEKIAALNKYLNTKRKVIITSKDGSEMSINPVEFSWDKDKLYLQYIDEEDALKKILLDDVVKVVNTRKEFKLMHSKEVIFELYGKLSKSYLLKDEERIIDYARDKIVIANYCEDKMKLFRRLLRYDILCKVIFPKTDVAEFKSMIENSLANIGELADNI